MTLKRVLNLQEEGTHVRLKQACDENGAHVFAKVRVADVLPIEKSGIDDESYRFALQSHFDFIVTDDAHIPLFAVEFDGPTHDTAEQQRRDQLKNALCERFNLPLLRINHRYIAKKYRNMDLLTWFVHVWFAKKWFDEAQESGEIPADEPFMPSGFITIPGRKERFPLWLSAPIRNRIQKLFFEGKVADMCHSHVVGEDRLGNYHAIAFIRISESTAVCVETAMRSQQFPVWLAEALDEIVAHQLWDALSDALEDPALAQAPEEVQGRIDNFLSQYAMRFAASFGGSLSIDSRRMKVSHSGPDTA